MDNNFRYDILGIDLIKEEYDVLMLEQSKGKELKVVDGKVVAIAQEQSHMQKLTELENWFDNYFEKQLIQSMWQSDFKISHDEYFNCDYSDMDELKAKGEEVRAEIKNLRISTKEINYGNIN